MDRTFHNVTGHVTYTDSGMYTFPFDRNGLSYVNLPPSVTMKCDDLPYCGWPYYFPIIQFSHLEYVTNGSIHSS